MEITHFVQIIASQFDETEPEEFVPETKFKDLSEWSSLKALFIIAVVAEEYNVNLTGDDIRNAQSINDLFEVVKSKSNI